jgi:hypothetical protein
MVTTWWRLAYEYDSRPLEAAIKIAYICMSLDWLRGPETTDSFQSAWRYDSKLEGTVNNAGTMELLPSGSEGAGGFVNSIRIGPGDRQLFDQQLPSATMVTAVR